MCSVFLEKDSRRREGLQAYLFVLPVCVCVCSGADLSALVREAAIAALRECMRLRPLGAKVVATTTAESGPQEPGPEGAAGVVARGSGGNFGEGSVAVVRMKHFLTAAAKIRPSVSEEVRGFLYTNKHNYSVNSHLLVNITMRERCV